MKKKHEVIVVDKIEISDSLNEQEAALFQDLEGTISLGLETSMEVVDALLSVRDNRLYREKFPSFSKYCEVRWGIKPNHAYTLIATYKVNAAIKADDPEAESVPPSHAKELNKLPDEEQPEALKEAKSEARKKGKQKVAVSDIATVVNKRVGKKDNEYEPALKTISKVCGEELSEKIRTGHTLRAKEVIEFAGLDKDEMKRIAPYISAGWKLKAAMGYQSTQMTPAHTIRQLCERAIEFGKFVLELDDWIVTVTKNERIEKKIFSFPGEGEDK